MKKIMFLTFVYLIIGCSQNHKSEIIQDSKNSFELIKRLPEKYKIEGTHNVIYLDKEYKEHNGTLKVKRIAVNQDNPTDQHNIELTINSARINYVIFTLPSNLIELILIKNVMPSPNGKVKKAITISYNVKEKRISNPNLDSFKILNKEFKNLYISSDTLTNRSKFNFTEGLAIVENYDGELFVFDKFY